MRYEYVGILCGASDHILNLKYEDIELKKETLEKDELIRKYGLDPSSSVHFDGSYSLKEENKYEIIKIIIVKEKKDIDNYELDIYFEIEQRMHQQIDFFISAVNMITDSFLYVILPLIYIKNLKTGDLTNHSFPYEIPNFNFRGNSGVNRSSRYLEKYELKNLIDSLNFVKENGILNTVKDYYNHYKWTNNGAIEFTTLMTCLEALLLNEKGELAHRISRNVAVLFSNDKESGIEMYARMKKLYDIRSKIVHEGKYDYTSYYKKYNKFPLIELKKIVYDVIMLYLNKNVNKNCLIKELETIGYGDFKTKFFEKS